NAPKILLRLGELKFDKATGGAAISFADDLADNFSMVCFVVEDDQWAGHDGCGQRDYRRIGKDDGGLRIFREEFALLCSLAGAGAGCVDAHFQRNGVWSSAPRGSCSSQLFAQVP